MMPGLLLDTHAAIWLDAGARMRETARQAIEDAAAVGGVFVSPVTAWELGMLVAKRRFGLDIAPEIWFERLLDLPGIRLAPLSPRAAIEASFLPGAFHGDPADRLLVATARELDVPIVTRDGSILDYARTGAVKTLRC